MIYTDEFKMKCFNTYRFTGRLVKLMKAMEAGKHTVVRYILEEQLEDRHLYLPLNQTKGEYIVKKERKNAYESRLEIYSEFMEKLNNHLDNEGARVLQEN